MALIASFVVVAALFARDARAQHSPASSGQGPQPTADDRSDRPYDHESYRQSICENKRSCHLARDALEDEKTLKVRNCMCDAECNTYGDCCFDSQLYNEADQKTNFKRFHCPKEQWYVKASCAPQFADRVIVSKCAEGVSGATSDLSLITPITDVERNVTYANVYCALCDNRDPRSGRFRVWSVTSVCGATNANAESASMQPPPPSLPATTTSTWSGVDARTTARVASRDDASNAGRDSAGGRGCEPLRQPPAGLDVGLRRCASVVAACPAAAAAELAAKCDSFTLLVHDDLVSYRNPFCAECNNVTRPLSGCRPHIEDRFSTSQRLFSASNKATGNAACSDPNANPDLKKRFCSS